MNWYYQQKKHLYRERYYRNKLLAAQKEEMFAPFGGERQYYKAKLLEWGMTIHTPTN